jgi:hypothetical protein
MKIENTIFRSNDEKGRGNFRMGQSFKLLSWAHNHVKLHKTRKENNQCYWVDFPITHGLYKVVHDCTFIVDHYNFNIVDHVV